MDHESNSGGTTCSSNFSFAFNDSNFSDRVLRIEIVQSAPDSKTTLGEIVGNGHWARHKKRRRADHTAEQGPDSLTTGGMPTDGQEEQVMTCNPHDIDDAPNEVEEDTVAMEELSPQAMQSSPSRGLEEGAQALNSWTSNTGSVIRTRTVHISSAILAAKSLFFYKLFSNGMRESEQRAVSLQISSSEETAFMDLLHFMYSGKVQASTPVTVLDVLIIADKFEVSSCMRHCSRVLRNLPMTPESALLYLELPSNILLAEAVHPLTDAARSFLAARYRDIGRYIDEVLNLPLVGLEAVLSSDDLQVASEDSVYDFVLKWARSRFPKVEDRRDILGSRMVWLIRFPMMSSRKLRKVLSCNDFEHELVSKLVLEALFFKSEPPHRQRQLFMEETLHKRFCERAYKYRPVKVVEFATPNQHCVVFLDLKMEDCKALWPQGRLYSQAFHLAGQGFFLSAHCNMDQQALSRCFGLFLGMQEKGAVSFKVDYEFSARTKSTGWDFVPKSKGSYLFTGGKAVGYRNLFGVAWQEFIAEQSSYFHNGILHLRAELTVKDAVSGARISPPVGNPRL